MSLFDSIKQNLTSDLWENGKLKKEARDEILGKLFICFPNKEEIAHLFLLGSMTGYQYNDESDVDVNVVLVSKDREERLKWHQFFKTYKPLLTNTLHPISYFAESYHQPNFQDAKFGVYNILKDEWEVKPTRPEREPDISFRDEIRFAKMMEYRWEEIWDEMLQGIAEQDQDKVERSIVGLQNIADKLDRERKSAYSVGWGAPRESLQNVLYKFFEKTKYNQFLTSLAK